MQVILLWRSSIMANNPACSIHNTEHVMWVSRSICIQKQRYAHTWYISSEIPWHFYHPRELRDSITGPNVRSTALFHRCANSERDLFPKMGSLTWKKFKAETIRIYCLVLFELYPKTFQRKMIAVLKIIQTSSVYSMRLILSHYYCWVW